MYGTLGFTSNGHTTDLRHLAGDKWDGWYPETTAALKTVMKRMQGAESDATKKADFLFRMLDRTLDVVSLVLLWPSRLVRWIGTPPILSYFQGGVYITQQVHDM